MVCFRNLGFRDSGLRGTKTLTASGSLQPVALFSECRFGHPSPKAPSRAEAALEASKFATLSFAVTLNPKLHDPQETSVADSADGKGPSKKKLHDYALYVGIRRVVLHSRILGSRLVKAAFDKGLM